MAFGFTYTLPTIVGSHTDFPVLLKTVDFPAAAIDGTANALANGGGNLTAYTSSAKSTQLPVEIVRLVSSGSPSAEVWVKIPTAATSNTIYIEADSVQTSQPAVSSTYGRDNVWSDYLAVLHLVESGNGTSGEFIDSTGNGYDGTGGGGIAAQTPSQTTTSHPWAGGVWQDFDGSNDWINIPTGADMDSSYISAQAMFVADVLTGTDEGIVSNRYSTQGNNFFQITMRSSRAIYDLHNGSSENFVIGAGKSTATDYWTAITSESGAIRGVINGTQEGVNTDSGDNQFDTTLDTRIGTYFDGSAGRSIEGKIGEVRLRLSTLTVAWYLVEYNNQSATSAWGTVGAWADTGGGGLSIPVAVHHYRNQGTM